MKMKKYLLAAIWILSSSLIETKQHFWIGSYNMIDEKANINWYGSRVIKANTINDAKRLFNNFIKTDKDLSKCEFIKLPNVGYVVEELKEENILK